MTSSHLLIGLVGITLFPSPRMRKQARPTGEEISGCYYICNYALASYGLSARIIDRTIIAYTKIDKMLL